MINNLINKKHILIVNPSLPKEVEYKKEMYKRFKNKEFNFKEIKRLSDDTIYNFHKIFIDSYSIHFVKPILTKYKGYTEHVKNNSKYFIDKENKILLLVK